MDECLLCIIDVYNTPCPRSMELARHDGVTGC